MRTETKPNKKLPLLLIYILYAMILPVATAMLLLVISPLFDRPIFMGSSLIDTGVRICLSIWFSLGYIRLPRLKEKYRIYPSRSWSKEEVKPATRYFLMAVGLAFGAMVGFITFWIIAVFLPVSGDLRLVLSVLNGLLFALPMIAQYEVFQM